MMKKILVAEDDKFLSNAFRLKLQKSGFEVNIAGDGQEALKSVKSSKPDLILLDLMMPAKDGFAVLSEIKSNSETKNIPVLIASNLGQKEDIDHGLSLGAVDFIVKSNLRLDELVEKIKSILKVA